MLSVQKYSLMIGWIVSSFLSNNDILTERAAAANSNLGMDTNLVGVTHDLHFFFYKNSFLEHEPHINQKAKNKLKTIRG